MCLVRWLLRAAISPSIQREVTAVPGGAVYQQVGQERHHQRAGRIGGALVADPSFQRPARFGRRLAVSQLASARIRSAPRLARSVSAMRRGLVDRVEIVEHDRDALPTWRYQRGATNMALPDPTGRCDELGR